MKTTWQALCADDPMVAVEGESAVVSFHDGRSHRVDVAETETTLEFSAIVAGAARVRHIDDLALRLWRRNRVARLVGFDLDRRGRVCARGWVPKAGLTASELRQVLHRVAIESDRLEFYLTGLDAQ